MLLGGQHKFSCITWDGSWLEASKSPCTSLDLTLQLSRARGPPGKPEWLILTTPGRFPDPLQPNITRNNLHLFIRHLRRHFPVPGKHTGCEQGTGPALKELRDEWRKQILKENQHAEGERSQGQCSTAVKSLETKAENLKGEIGSGAAGWGGGAGVQTPALPPPRLVIRDSYLTSHHSPPCL